MQTYNEHNPVDIIGMYPCETTMRLGLPYLQGGDYLYCFITKYGVQSILDKPVENEAQEANRYVLS